MADTDPSLVREIRFSAGATFDQDDAHEDCATPPATKRLRTAPVPVASSSRSDAQPLATAKVQELFFSWLCNGETQVAIRKLIEDTLHGREIEKPSIKQLPVGDQMKYGTAPKSPVSRLIRSSATFPASPVPQTRAGQQQRSLHPSLQNLQDALHGDSDDSFDSVQLSETVGLSSSQRAGSLSSLSRRTSFGSTAGSAIQGTSIKQFYFPLGRVNPPEVDFEELNGAVSAFREKAKMGNSNGISKHELFGLIVEVMGLPSFLCTFIFEQILSFADAASVHGDENTFSMDFSQRELISEDMFMGHFRKFCVGKSPPARLFYVLLGEKTKSHLERDDLRCVLEGVLEYHPGLAFLRKTPEFQSRYTETVIERIFYSCAKRNSRSLFLGDVVKSRLLDCLLWLDREEDINLERRFFSYKHFYVLYCRFWELDTDHDLLISIDDLLRYGNGALTVRIAERIFAGCGKVTDSPIQEKLSYTDFVWFCLSEEDKKSARALDYWFRCVDLDGDGIITLADVEYFYREQYVRMEDRNLEPIQFVDIVCQLLDMLKYPPQRSPLIRKEDLRRCNMQSVFFNFLFNLNKFFQIESRDPRMLQQERANLELTEWDRFAAAEYERLTSVEDDYLTMNTDATVPEMDL